MAKAVFLGQKPLGEICFEHLRQTRGLEVVGAVTNRSPESVWWRSAAIWDAAQTSDIPVLDNVERDDERLSTLIAETQADVLISVQHNWIVSSSVLDAVGGRGFNLHLAPLPDYKGYNAFSHAILNGATTFGVSLHWMAEAADAGDMAYSRMFPLNGRETSRQIYEIAFQAGLACFDALLVDLCEGRDIPRTPLVGEGSFYGRASLNDLREVSLNADPETIARRARAFAFEPFEPAYFKVDGRKYYIRPEPTETD